GSVCSSATNHEFLKNFRTLYDPQQQLRNRLDVQLFRLVLFDQFPNLKQLTLIGNVYHHKVTKQRLGEELKGKLERLDMFFRNKNVPPDNLNGLLKSKEFCFK